MTKKNQFTDDNIAETGLSVIKAILSGLGALALVQIQTGLVDYRVLLAVITFFVLSTLGKILQEYRRSDR